MFTPDETPNQIRSIPRCSAAGVSIGIMMKAISKKSRKNASHENEGVDKDQETDLPSRQ